MSVLAASVLLTMSKQTRVMIFPAAPTPLSTLLFDAVSGGSGGGSFSSPVSFLTPSRAAIDRGDEQRLMSPVKTAAALY